MSPYPQTELKATEKRWVFRLDLKLSMVVQDFMCSGRLFQSVGPITENARSPLVTKFGGGMARSICVEDLSALTAGGAEMKSERYCGARPFKALKTKSKILKSIRYVTGSQGVHSPFL